MTSCQVGTAPPPASWDLSSYVHICHTRGMDDTTVWTFTSRPDGTTTYETHEMTPKERADWALYEADIRMDRTLDALD